MDNKNKPYQKFKNCFQNNIIKYIFILLVIFIGAQVILYSSSFCVADTKCAKLNYITSLCSLVSVITLFITFLNQSRNYKLDKFENRFFLMVNLHKSNVDDILILGEKFDCKEDNASQYELKGKKVFVHLIREFRQIFLHVKKELENSHKKEEEIINIAYLFFYYGTGPHSRRILISELKNVESRIIEKLINDFDEDRKVTKDNYEYRKYEYYGGHQSRLGHYYRHLYQTICYVDQQKNDVDKKGYAKILRAQLSNHEQALLALNALSNLGKEWIDSKLICEYEMIKNIPRDFFDPDAELNIKKLFKDIKFEYESN